MVQFILQSKTGRRSVLDYDPARHVLSEKGRELSFPPQYLATSFAFQHQKQNEVTLRVALGKKCNFACRYCYQKITTAAERVEEAVSPEFLERFIEGCKKARIRYPFHNIQFWGGEPLVYFRELVYLHRRFVEEFDNDLEFFIITNGSLLFGERLEWILSHPEVHVSISWDGPGQFLRGRNVFAESPSREGIQRLFRECPDTTIMPVINRFSRGVSDILQEARRLGFCIEAVSDAHLVKVSDPRMQALALPVTALPAYSRRLFHDLLAQRIRPYGTFFQGVYSWLARLGKPVQPGTEFFCLFKKENIVTLDLEGNFLTCPNFTAKAVDDEGYPHKLGNVFQSLERHFPPRHAFQKAMRACRHCTVFVLCRGGCPFSNPRYAAYNCAANYYQHLPVIGYALFLLTGDILSEVRNETPPA